MAPAPPKPLERTQWFFLALADRDIERASAELGPTATYHVPGTSPLAGIFKGREEMVRRFQQLFELTSGSEALKWVDWMLGTNLASVLVQIKLQAGLSSFEGSLLFAVGFDPSGLISEVRLFLEDQARFDRFLAQLPTA